MTRPQGASSAQGSLAARYARTRGDRFGLGRATITELDTDTGKRPCSVRPRVEAEPDDAKGRDEAGPQGVPSAQGPLATRFARTRGVRIGLGHAPKNGAIKC